MMNTHNNQQAQALTLAPQDVDSPEMTAVKLIHVVASDYVIEKVATGNGLFIDYIIPSGETSRAIPNTFKPKAFHELLNTKTAEDLLRWIRRHGYLHTQYPTSKNPDVEMISGVAEPYPLADIEARVNRLKDIWMLISQIADGGGSLLNSVKSVLLEADNATAPCWHSANTIFIEGSPLPILPYYFLAIGGKLIRGTYHPEPSLTSNERDRLLINGIAVLILELTEGKYYDQPTTVAAPHGSILPWRIERKTVCTSPQTYYLIWMLSFLTNQKGRHCEKCKTLFAFDDNDVRPGKLKYCPACAGTAPQRNYKERSRSARNAVQNGDLTLQEAAAKYSIKEQRLSKILSGETSI